MQLATLAGNSRDMDQSYRIAILIRNRAGNAGHRHDNIGRKAFQPSARHRHSLLAADGGVPFDKLARYANRRGFGGLAVDHDPAVERIAGSLDIRKQAGQRTGRT